MNRGVMRCVVQSLSNHKLSLPFNTIAWLGACLVGLAPATAGAKPGDLVSLGKPTLITVNHGNDSTQAMALALQNIADIAPSLQPIGDQFKDWSYDRGCSQRPASIHFKVDQFAFASEIDGKIWVEARTCPNSPVPRGHRVRVDMRGSLPNIANNYNEVHFDICIVEQKPGGAFVAAVTAEAVEGPDRGRFVGPKVFEALKNHVFQNAPRSFVKMIDQNAELLAAAHMPRATLVAMMKLNDANATRACRP